MKTKHAINIGRRRGEFELAAKKLVAVHAGREHPRDAGFIHKDELAQRAEGAAQFVNGLKKEGRIQFGIPDQRWTQSVTANPLRKLPEAKLWIFFPDHAEVSLRGGQITVKRGRKYFQFSDPETFARLGAGYRVIVYFDASEPSLGATIINREPVESSRNTQRLPIGRTICTASHSPLAPQIDQSRSPSGTVAKRKQFNDYVATAFRAILSAGQMTPATTEIRDGDGNVARAARGIAPPAQHQIPKPKITELESEAQRPQTSIEIQETEERTEGPARRRQILIETETTI